MLFYTKGLFIFGGKVTILFHFNKKSLTLLNKTFINLNTKYMNRRDFLKRTGGLGMIMATSQLPAFAEDNPAVFPERGVFERLSLNYATIHIGLERPFSVLHISDTHLTAAYAHENEKKQTLHKTRTQTFGGRQEEALRDTLAWAKDNVDYIIHTGDLIDWQSEANFDLVRKYFGSDMIGCLGNHEYSTDMWLSNPQEEHTEQFKDNTRHLVQQAYPFNVRYHAQVINGVNFITLDDVYAYVTQEQVDFVKSEAAKRLPMVLCMHVPFYSDNLWRVNNRYWKNVNRHFVSAEIPDIDGEYRLQREDPVTSSFITYLKNEPLLKAILAGHVHFTMQDRFSATASQYTVAGNFLFHGEEILFV